MSGHADFELLAEQMSYSARVGDRVRVRAKTVWLWHLGHDGKEGVITRFAPHGWINVRLDSDCGETRFRADELLEL